MVSVRLRTAVCSLVFYKSHGQNKRMIIFSVNALIIVDVNQ